jgi:hypothetical protein
MNSNFFCLKDCNLALIATGIMAESLIELRDHLHRIPTSSLYYHFWGGRLRMSFVHPEYHNDFSWWAHFGLHDDILTERLAIIDPTEYKDIEDLRKRLIQVIENRIAEVDYMPWSRNENRFHFLRSTIIVYDLCHEPLGCVNSDLKTFISKMTPTSVFYHFIDARRRTSDGSDDFSVWLAGFGTQYEELIKKIKLIDPYFLSLSEIRKLLTELFNEHL